MMKDADLREHAMNTVPPEVTDDTMAANRDSPTTSTIKRDGGVGTRPGSRDMS